MRKEVSVTHEVLACEVCGRTILKGERTEPYLVQDGSRRLVCELCMRRAESAGWIREAAHADMPATPLGTEQRPSLLERFRSRWRANGPARRSRPGRVEVAANEPDEAIVAEDPAPAASPYYEADAAAEEPSGEELPPVMEPAASEVVDEPYALHEPPAGDRIYGPADPGVQEEAGAGAPDERGVEEPAPVEAPVADSPTARDSRFRHRLRDPRHVRAVPTNAEVKVERALEVFNYSDYRRTVEGLVRTLGEPWVTAVPVLDSTSEVIVVVAWELSWYQYRIDLGDSDDPVVLTHKGKELGELDVTMREWNAIADSDGALALAGSRSG